MNRPTPTQKREKNATRVAAMGRFMGPIRHARPHGIAEEAVKVPTRSPSAAFGWKRKAATRAARTGPATRAQGSNVSPVTAGERPRRAATPITDRTNSHDPARSTAQPHSNCRKVQNIRAESKRTDPAPRDLRGGHDTGWDAATHRGADGAFPGGNGARPAASYPELRGGEGTLSVRCVETFLQGAFAVQFIRSVVAAGALAGLVALSGAAQPPAPEQAPATRQPPDPGERRGGGPGQQVSVE